MVWVRPLAASERSRDLRMLVMRDRKKTPVLKSALADGIMAARFARTETSARPVSWAAFYSLHEVMFRRIGLIDPQRPADHERIAALLDGRTVDHAEVRRACACVQAELLCLHALCTDNAA
jgi:hypothetical protein